MRSRTTGQARVQVESVGDWPRKMQKGPRGETPCFSPGDKVIYTPGVFVTFWSMAVSKTDAMAGDVETGGDTLLKSTNLYREFQAEKEEILKHKWIESEKVGYDIGFERALVDWITRHRSAWNQVRRQS